MRVERYHSVFQFHNRDGDNAFRFRDDHDRRNGDHADGHRFAKRSRGNDDISRRNDDAGNRDSEFGNGNAFYVVQQRGDGIDHGRVCGIDDLCDEHLERGECDGDGVQPDRDDDARGLDNDTHGRQ